MASTSPNVSNLRPFPKGWKGGPGNPFLAEANKFRAEFYNASTDARRKALMNLLWDQALGLHRPLQWHVDEDTGEATLKTHPDGSPVLGAPEPPAPWAEKMIMEFIGGSVAFKSIEATVTADVSNIEERARRVARVLVDEGLGDRLPAPMRALVEAKETM